MTRILHKAGNLLAKKPGAAGGRMADAARAYMKFSKLSSGDFSQRDELFARK